MVSIIVPVQNAKHTIGECMQSLQNLNYPKDGLEIIVVDNHSSDGSDKIAEKFKVKMLFETSVESSYAARNRGIKEAKGEIIAFTDSDCVVHPEWLSFLIKDWNDKSVGCFAGEIKAYKPKTIVEKFSERKGILSQSHTLNHRYLPYAQTANVAYRREVFEKIGYFDPEMRSGGDADLSWKMQKKTSFKIRFVPEAIVHHKHRTTVGGLYKQFQKYEYGMMFWKKRYPDCPIPSIGRRFLALIGALTKVFLLFPINMFKFLFRRIDSTEFLSPFLVCIMVMGTLSARFKRGNVLEKR